MDVSDETLARAAADGDRQAFAALVGRVYDRVYAYAYRVTGSKADAEDLAQDICAALPVKLKGWRGEARVTTWLYRITVNAARDRFRRQASFARAADGWGDWELARRAEAAETAERVDWLHAAMTALNRDLRETLALVLDGVSHGEAASILGISEGTVSWRISEAKKRLRAIRAAEAEETKA
ncbi:RNA polymerase sigma factor [Pseudoponticoccus marisrubri]|uniref:RNA polymerase subunit sigma-70 n=1 Tax=Pseudoponticoccus marisrubri TaxID=1685382 RepID=A0A0W7WJ55_9RHOB|nr:RNA polymerase sigma factor [Pseudoponticoccus marisrubri]KUF10621.1 RNA polymerase subunit sigma-70 [Pseudoponticoccus marisrubri]